MINKHSNYLATVLGTVLKVHDIVVTEIDIIPSPTGLLDNQGLERCHRPFHPKPDNSLGRESRASEICKIHPVLATDI